MFFGVASGFVRVKDICIIAAPSETSPIRSWGGYHLRLYHMAIINSLAIGAAVKSAGNLTYKRTRGRTIASQRITQNTSKSSAQTSQRDVFAMQARMAKSIAAWIDLSFPKTKYGSQRNNFISSAKSALQAFIRVDQIGQGLPDLIQSSAKAAQVGKLLLAGKGEYTLQCEYPLAKVSNLSMPAVLSRAFAVGDRVAVMVAQVYTLPSFPDMMLESVQVVETTLTAENVPAAGSITINSVLIPELANLNSLLPAGAVVMGQLFSATVIGMDKSTCSTLFSIIPWEVEQYNAVSGTDSASALTLVLDKAFPVGYMGALFNYPGQEPFTITAINDKTITATVPAGVEIVYGEYKHAQKVAPVLVTKAGLDTIVIDGVGTLDFVY